MNEITNKMKRQPAKQTKKKFVNNLYDKELIFKIYRELIKLNLKKKKLPD